MKTIREKFYNFAVSDFDGTLLQTDRTLSEFSLKTIEQFIKNGGTFYICTGRMTSSIMSYCKNYGLGGYVISYNGAEIVEVSTAKKIFSNHVDNLACIKLLEYAEKNNLTVQTYPNDQLLAQNANEMVNEYSGRVNVPITQSEQKVSEIFKQNGYTSAKVLFYTNDQMADSMLKEIKQILGSDYNVTRSNEFHIDIMKKGISKGETVLILAKLLNLDTSKLICFGDERNDVSMLSVAGLGVACANANKELIAVADVVTNSCDDDGVAKALIKYGV